MVDIRLDIMNNIQRVKPSERKVVDLVFKLDPMVYVTPMDVFEL